MSNLNITEYANLGRDVSGYVIPVGEAEELAVQNVSFTTSSVQSSAFNAKTRFIRVVADVDTKISFGLNPTASATTMTLPSGTVEYFGIKPGKSYIVAAVQL